MSRFSFGVSTLRVGLSAGVLALVASAASAQTITYGVCLDGAQEFPPVATSGTGFAIVTLDTMTGAVSVSGSYKDLAGNQTLAHIHGPATRAQNAGLVVTLAGTGGTSGTFSGNGVLSAGQIADMTNGLHYLNIHSEAHGNGEIRGQIEQLANVVLPPELVTDPTLSDCGGNPEIGPKIGNSVEDFDLQLDCSGAGASGFYSVVVRLPSAQPPVASPLGTIWCRGNRVFRCIGMHNQNVVKCPGGGGQQLPNDPKFVGLSVCIQGVCLDPSNPQGRLSNGLVTTVGQ